MIPVWALQLILHVSFRYQNAVGWGGVGCLYGYGGRPCRISCKLGGRQFCSDLHWLCPWPPSLPMSFLPMSFLALFTLGSHTVWPRDPQPSYHTLRYARSRHSNAFVCLWCAHVWYGEVQQLCQPRLQTWLLLPLRPTWSTAKGRHLEITYVFFLYLAQPSHRCILPATVCSGQGLDVSSSLCAGRRRVPEKATTARRFAGLVCLCASRSSFLFWADSQEGLYQGLLVACGALGVMQMHYICTREFTTKHAIECSTK